MSHTFTIPYTRLTIPSRGDFPAQVKYSPIVSTILENKIHRLEFSFDSIIDSGADYCVFPAYLGELIGLNVELGQRLPMYGVGGKEILYFHHIKVIVIIEKQAWEFKCFVGFSKKMNIKGLGFLGRQGFFNLFNKIEFLENQRKLRLIAEEDSISHLRQGGLIF